MPAKLMWSVIAITEPGGMSSRRLPAALVCSRVSQPSSATARMAPLHLVGLAVLVVVRAALQHGDRRRPDMAQHQPAGMAADAWSAGSPAARRRGWSRPASPRRRSAPRPEPRITATLGLKPGALARRCASVMASPRCCGPNDIGRSSPRVTVRCRPSGPQRWTGRSSAANSRSFWRQPPQGVIELRPRPDHHALQDALAAGRDHGGDGTGLGAQCPADRPRSRRCSRHGSSRPRRARAAPTWNFE